MVAGATKETATEVIEFFVQGVPKSMQISGVARFRRGDKVHMVPKRGNTEWALLVGQIGREHAPAVPLNGPVRVSASFFLPRPKSAPKKVVWPLTRPDLDNLLFKLLDQFNGVLWRDDSQCVALDVSKEYASNGRSGLRFQVEALK